MDELKEESLLRNKYFILANCHIQIREENNNTKCKKEYKEWINYYGTYLNEIENIIKAYGGIIKNKYFYKYCYNLSISKHIPNFSRDN